MKYTKYHYDLNDDWEFFSVYRDFLQTGGEAGEGEKVRLPHTVKNIPLSYCDEKSYQMVSAYRRKLRADKEWQGKRVFLNIGAAAHCAEVFVNGTFAGEHRCGYTAFTVDITDFLDYDRDNVILIKVDSRESRNVPPFGFVIDYLTYGGIYREVSLDIKNPSYIFGLFARAGEENGRAVLDCDVFVNREGLTVKGAVYDGEKLIADLGTARTNGDRACFTREVSGARLWHVSDPALYTLRVELFDSENSNAVHLDTKEIRIGFRKCEFRSDGFYLNGEKIILRGLNRHQSWPYVGYAMPKRPQRLDADILKYELKCNAVRTSHYPQSHHFISRCDEIGLLVFTEIPGWQHIGDNAWKDEACKNTRDMVIEYRNHPSIILWGVRINESQDDDEFYARTNAIAHELDPTRQTGGVRFISKSHLLEDVYTLNDFSHDGTNAGVRPKKEGTADMSKGYMVTEYCGHMYPTKTYDDEPHQLNHVLRHARVLNDAASHSDIAGTFGWCFADYNTHASFGSGDRICHHGVMDMFRNPKPAAAVYKSQQDEEPFLGVTSSMNIGDYPGGYLKDVYVFSNADTIRYYKDNVFISETAPSGEFPALAHSPFHVIDLIGNQIVENGDLDAASAKTFKKLVRAALQYGPARLPAAEKLRLFWFIAVKRISMKKLFALVGKYVINWGSGVNSHRFEALKNGRVTATLSREPVESPDLELIADTAILREEETYDAATVRIRGVDQNGNILPYLFEPLELDISGPGEIIGPKVIALQGGMAGTYVKTTGGKGKVQLTVKTHGFAPKTLDFEVQ
jgi:beta-galactosidase